MWLVNIRQVVATLVESVCAHPRLKLTINLGQLRLELNTYRKRLVTTIYVLRAKPILFYFNLCI